MPIKLVFIESYDELEEARLATRAGRGMVNLLQNIDWDPMLHPRDRYGRFINTPDRLTPVQRVMATPSVPADGQKPPSYPNTAEWKDKAGQPIRAGQGFKWDSREWEVSFVAGSVMVVDEASGDKAKAETRILNPADFGNTDGVMAGIKPPTTKKLTGWKTKDSEERNVRVVNPHNEPTTHDPSLQIPANSKIKPEEWKEFGKVEQLHYIHLMQQLGEWKSGAPIAKIIKGILSEYDNDVVKAVKQAHHEQYGASTGETLSLTDYSGSKSQWELRAQAMELQARLRDIIAWDLYNRVQAPDVAVFHGSHNGPSWWKNLVGSPVGKIFSALSQSFSIKSAQSFGATIWAAPVSIRHIALATHVTDWSGYGSSFKKENEIAIVAEQVPNMERATVFGWNDLSMSARGWLLKTTKQIKAGSHIALLKEHMEQGGELPYAVDPDIRFPDKNVIPPPPAALEAMEQYGDQLPKIADAPYPPSALPGGLPFAHRTEDGLPEARIAAEAGIKEGDFMLGLKGTLYWIGPDNGDFGLRYHKIVRDPSTGELAFNGESYEFEGAGANEYYFLQGNVPPLPLPDAPDFDPQAWQMAAEQPMQIGKMAPQSVFKVDGKVYRIATPEEKSKLGKLSGTRVAIYDMATGDIGSINTEYKAVRMIPAVGYSATVDLKPTKGMTLPYKGKKAVVTSVKKDGIVSIKPTGGKVVKLAPDDPALEELFNPDEWAVADKVQLGSLYAGQLFHGGTGKAIRPYKVLEVDGSKVRWRNLDTGEEGEWGAKKAVRRLDPVKGTASAEQADAQKPSEPPMPDPDTLPAGEPQAVPDNIDPPALDIDSLPIVPVFNAYTSTHGSGGKVKHHKVKEMPEGTVFQDKNGTLFKVLYPGPMSVLTDGEKLYQHDGNTRGKVVPGAQLATPTGVTQPAPPPNAPEPSPAAAAPPLADNIDKKPVMALLMDATASAPNDKVKMWFKRPDGLLLSLQKDDAGEWELFAHPDIGDPVSTGKPSGGMLTSVPSGYAVTGVNTGNSGTSVLGKADPSPDSEPDLTVGNLTADDEFVGGDGQAWTVLASGDSTTYIQSQVTGEAQNIPNTTPTSAVGPAKPGPTAESIGDLPFDIGLTEEQLQNAEYADMNFFASTHGSGGKYKHYPLGQLNPGDSFRVSGDKTEWKLVKLLTGGYALVYAPNLGSVLKVDANGKVKKL